MKVTSDEKYMTPLKYDELCIGSYIQVAIVNSWWLSPPIDRWGMLTHWGQDKMAATSQTMF